jgi:hypothetical protein
MSRQRWTMIMATLAGAMSALMLAGCGERPQVVNYKQGEYQGKPDTPAFNGPPFNGDREQWDKAMKQRAQSQNEYKRIGG